MGMGLHWFWLIVSLGLPSYPLATNLDVAEEAVLFHWDVFLLASPNDHPGCVVLFAEAWAKLCPLGVSPVSGQSLQLQRAQLPFLRSSFLFLPGSSSLQLPGGEGLQTGNSVAPCLCPRESLHWWLWTACQTFTNCVKSGSSALFTQTAFNTVPV